MSELRIKTCVLGVVSTNCYIVYRQKENETEELIPAVLIDPADNVQYLLRFCKDMGVKPVAILLTHGHFDHILAAKDLKKEFNIPVYAGEAEVKLLETPDMNLSPMYGDAYVLSPDILLRDHEILELLGMKWQVLTTPGHTAGSVCYLIEEEEVLFSGDTLFEESLGRTDLPTASSSEIINSITEKLFTLADHIMVYPGHGEPTSIGHEKTHNPVAHYNRR